MTNWERKSSYLLREIVKFRTYIDSLTAAQTHKDKIYAEREADPLNGDLDDAEVSQTQSVPPENDGGLKAAHAPEAQSITT